MAKQSGPIESQLLELVYSFIKEIDPSRSVSGITLNASLEGDLGIDSLGRVELFHRIESTFKIRLPEAILVEADTIEDLLKAIETAQPQKIIHQKIITTAYEKAEVDLSTAKTLVDVLLKYVEADPMRPHIYLQDEQGEEQLITYGELLTAAASIAQGLIKRGIKHGETVALMLPTSSDFFFAFYGVLIAGAIPVPIYPPFRPDRIEEYAKLEANILQNAEARILITFAETKKIGTLLKTFIPSLIEVTSVAPLMESPSELPNDLTFEADQPAFIQYTSGSTGNPKGVLIHHSNVFANIQAVTQVVHIRPRDVAVSWLPLYHDMGLMSWLASLYVGIPLVSLSPLTFLSRPEKWLWAIHYHRATFSAAPNFAYELCVKKINK